MPRLMIQNGLLPNSLITREIAESIEIFGLMYAYNSGMLDDIVDNKMLQGAILAGLYTAYDNIILSPQYR